LIIFSEKDMDPERFLTHSLQQDPAFEPIISVLQAAMQAVDPILAVQGAMKLTGDTLTIARRDYDLRQYRDIVVTGFGKASAAMAEGTSAILGARIQRGAVIVKYVEPEQAARIPS
jgi:glycerate-2-kinase